MLTGKGHQRHLRNVKAISKEFQNELVVADIGKEKTKQVVRKTCIERTKTCLLKVEKIRKRLEEN